MGLLDFFKPKKNDSDYFEKGNELLIKKEYKEAILNYSCAIDLNDNNYNYFLKRGIAKYYLKDFHEAIFDFTRAINLNPTDSLSYNYRGECKSDLKEYDKAIEDFTDSINIDNQNGETYFNRGLARSNIGNSFGAIEDFNKSIELIPNFIEAYNNRGSEKSVINDNLGAIEDFSKCIDLNPKNGNFYFNRGYSKFNIANYSSAIGDYTMAIDLNPSDKDSIYNREISINKFINNYINENNSNEVISFDEVIKALKKENEFSLDLETLIYLEKTINSLNKIGNEFSSKISEQLSPLFTENKTKNLNWLHNVSPICFDDGNSELRTNVFYTDDYESVFMNTETIKKAENVIIDIINDNGGIANFTKEVRKGFELFYLGENFSVSWSYTAFGIILVEIVLKTSSIFQNQLNNKEISESNYKKMKAIYLNSEANDYFDNLQYIQGIESVKKALELIPNESSFIDTLALGYHLSGEDILAIEEINKCIEIDVNENSEYAEHYCTRAKINLKLNNKEKAIEDLKKALEIEYDFVEAINLFKTIENNN